MFLNNKFFSKILTSQIVCILKTLKLGGKRVLKGYRVFGFFNFIFKTPVKKTGDGRKVTFFEPGSEETSTSK